MRGRATFLAVALAVGCAQAPNLEATMAARIALTSTELALHSPTPPPTETLPATIVPASTVTETPTLMPTTAPTEEIGAHGHAHPGCTRDRVRGEGV